ncbi:HdeA/HdeB family chaperone [Bradyrhizobium guangxiense]
MVPSRAASAALLAATLLVSQAEAQVMVDVSKITCEQYITQRITHTRTVNIWLSGFYAGRRNNPVLDTQQLERNGNRLSRFCESNRDMLLLDAVGALKN